MSTKRTPLRRAHHPPISDEMVRVWEELRAIVAGGGHRTWEQQGGQKSRFYDLNTKLSNELLNRGPHEAPMRATLSMVRVRPMTKVGSDGASASSGKESYESAFELARLLDAAAAAARRYTRPQVSTAKMPEREPHEL